MIERKFEATTGLPGRRINSVRPNEPVSKNYRGHLLEAVKADRGWTALVDGKPVGKKGEVHPTSREAVLRAEKFVNRSEGKKTAGSESKSDTESESDEARTPLVDDEFWAAMRRSIKAGR